MRSARLFIRIFYQRRLLRGDLLLYLIRMLLGKGLSVCRRLLRFRKTGCLLSRLLFLCDAGIGGAGRLCGLEIRNWMHHLDALHKQSPLPYVLEAFIGIAAFYVLGTPNFNEL